MTSDMGMEDQGENFSSSSHISNVEGGIHGSIIAGRDVVVYVHNLARPHSSLAIASADAASQECPYRGLYHFGPDDAKYFFGREIFITRLAKATERQNLIAVIGASGSGKSSVVLAGLAPALEARQPNNWTFTHFRPSKDPYHALATALLPLYSPDGASSVYQLAAGLRNHDLSLPAVISEIQLNNAKKRLLLIADQFEEIYTECSDPNLRNQFLDTLLTTVQTSNNDVASGFNLILTLRADFMSAALTYRPFAEALQGADIKLGPMMRDELALAVEKPAQKVGLAFEEGLVERILDDVSDEPGHLPLLEFALTLLWERQNAGFFTHQAYESIGKVEGALARYADQEYTDLSKTEREQARRIFIQLVYPGQGTLDTRRLATKQEFGEANWQLVKQLADSRLVVTGRNEDEDETVEVVHEALIRNWGRLRQWMTEYRTFRAWQERLRVAIRQWQANDQDPGGLLRGGPLAEAEEWLAQRDADLTEAERDFIQTSIDLREQEANEREAQRQRELEQQRALAEEQRQRAEEQVQATNALRQRAMWLIGAVVVAVLLAIAASVFSVRSNENANLAATQEAQARAAQETAVAERDRANAESTRAIQAGATAEAEAKRAETEANRAEAEQQEAERQREIAEVRRVEAEQQQKIAEELQLEAEARAVLANARGQLEDDPQLAVLLTLAAQDITPVSREAAQILTDLPYRPFPIETTLFGTGGSLVWSADGKKLLSGNKLWDLTLSRPITSPVMSNVAAVSREGSMVALESERNHDLIVWDLGRDQAIATLSGHTDMSVRNGMTTAFSPDGKYLASGARDGSVIVWDIAGDRPVVEQVREMSIWQVAWSPDSTKLAFGSATDAPGPLEIWDITTNRSAVTLSGGSFSNIDRFSWSPDGAWLVLRRTYFADIVWDAASGQVVTPSFSPSPGSASADWNWSPQGKWLLAPADDQISVVDFSADQTVITLPENGDGYWSPDGARLAVWNSETNTVNVWDVAENLIVARLEKADHTASLLAWSPDGARLASASDQGGIVVWDVETGQILLDFKGHADQIVNLAWRADGQQLASGGDNATVVIWNVDSDSQSVTTFEGYPVAVFNRDRTLLALHSEGDTVTVWDVAQNRAVADLSGQSDGVSDVIWSSNGAQLAVVANDNTISLWDAASGKALSRLTESTQPTSQVAWSPTNQQIAVLADDNTITIWDAASGEALAELTGHAELTTPVTWSRDGAFIVFGGSDGTVIVWDVAANEAMATLDGHSGAVTRLIWNADNTQIVSGTDDNEIIVWDVANEQALHTLHGTSTPLNGFRWSPEKNWLLAYSGKNYGDTVTIWNAATGQAAQTLNGLGGLVFDPGEAHAIARTSYDAVVIWDVVSRQPLTTLRGNSIKAMSSDGTRLVTSDRNAGMILWDVTSGKFLATLDQDNNTNGATVAFNQDSTILTVSTENRVSIWDAVTGQFITELEEHRLVAASPDGDRLALELDGEIVIWDALQNKSIATLDQAADTTLDLIWSRDGTRLASIDRGSQITIWDPAAGQSLTTIPTSGLAKVTVALSPDGSKLASTTLLSFGVTLWDTTTGQSITNLDGHNLGINDIAFSRDGTRLATASDDRMVIIWDVDTGQEVTKLEGHTDEVQNLAWSPDGSHLVSITDRRFPGTTNTAIIWDTVTGQALATVETGQAIRTAAGRGPELNWSADGSRLALADGKLWDLESNQLINAPWQGEYTNAELSADGNRLAAHSMEQNVIVWDLATGQAVNILEDVSIVDWSRDRKNLILRADNANKIMIWDVVADKITHTLEGIDISSASTNSWSPDEQRLAFGSRDGTVILWDLSHDMPVTRTLKGHSGSVVELDWNADGSLLLSRERLQDEKINAYIVWDAITGKALNAFTSESYYRWEANNPSLISRSSDKIEILDPKFSMSPCWWISRDLSREEWDRYLSQGLPYKRTCPNLPTYPDVVAPFLEKGQDLAKAGDIEEAALQFEKALELDPTLRISPRTEANKYFVQELVNNAADRARKDDSEGAVIQLEKALALDPDLAYKSQYSWDVASIMIQFRLKIGQLARQGNLEEVAKLYNTMEALSGDLGRIATRYYVAQSLISHLSSDEISQIDQELANIAEAQLLFFTGMDFLIVGEQQKATAQFEKAFVGISRSDQIVVKKLFAQDLKTYSAFFKPQGAFDAIIVAYQEAQRLDPSLQITGSDWNSLCWDGSLRGYAEDVLNACERAVETAPNNAAYRDSRGVARALTGDFQGAVEDFDFAVQAWEVRGDASLAAQRKEWVVELEAGRNPFDEALLQELR